MGIGGQGQKARSSNDPWQLRTLGHGGRPWKSAGSADPSARQELGKTAALRKSIGKSKPGRGDALRKKSRPANPTAAEHDARRRKAVPSEEHTARRQQHRNSTQRIGNTMIRRLASGRSSGRRAREKNQTRDEQLGSSIGAETRRRPLREDPKRKQLEHTETKTENPNHTRRTPWRRARDGLLREVPRPSDGALRNELLRKPKP
jgi:hypothetical protein